MNTGSLRLAWSARVYTIVLTFIVSAVTAVPAQTPVTVEPVMTKGAADAPVTIVEFSDYQ